MKHVTRLGFCFLGFGTCIFRCTKFLQRDFKEIISGPGMFRSFFCGGTDNKAAESLSSKLLTTKVPLMFVLMQFVDLCDHMGVRCNLNWRPRDANVEADRITKHLLDDFSADLRVTVSWSEIDLSVLNPLLDFCNFRKELDSVKFSAPLEAISAGMKFEKSTWGYVDAPRLRWGVDIAYPSSPPKLPEPLTFVKNVGGLDRIQRRLFHPKHG